MNRLQFAHSPYLLQHAHNPVDWFPWGEAAFEKARREQKPVLVSIGYAACHWCHVMEKESFEDEETAELMNREFVCIKVDREEHPEVDHFYMDALQALAGHGGWPLNMFVTPDRRPFYGGTYFPPRPVQGRNSWKGVLEAVVEVWKKQPDQVIQQAAQITAHLKQASLFSTLDPRSAVPGLPREILENILKAADREFGGFGPAPKFPGSFALQYLLTFAQLHGSAHPELSEEAMGHARLSLDCMMSGGLYDQVGGGFARYSTDRYWFAPHFEKMLYDNALLISVYADAFRLTGDRKYKEVVVRCIDFCNRSLREPSVPVYFCALDADSEGVEGKFYTWSDSEWEALRPSVHPAVKEYFGLRPGGNWEGTNILYRATTEAQIQTSYNLSETSWEKLLEETRTQLLAARAGRVNPALDDKALLSWNALMVLALTDAAAALEEPDYLRQAGRLLDFLLETFFLEGRWFHAYKAGEAYLEANLDDLSYLIKALLRYSEHAGRLKYLVRAAEIADYVDQHFSETGQVFYFYSPSSKQDIPVRKQEVYDGATPSANAVMAYNLRALSAAFHHAAWQQRADKMLDAMQDAALRHPTSFALWAQLLQCRVQGWMQVIILGDPEESQISVLRQSLGPNVFVLKAEAGGPDIPAMKGLDRLPGTPRYLLCREWRCTPPETDVRELLRQIKKSE